MARDPAGAGRARGEIMLEREVLDNGCRVRGVPPVRGLPPLLLWIGAGAALGLVAVWIGGVPSLPLSEPRVLALIVALPLLYVLCIAVHEAGHVAAALLVGFRPLLFIAGPLRLERVADRVAAGVNRSLALAGGLAVCTPVGMHDLRRRTLIMAAGGPLASLMFGVQCLAIWMATAQFTRVGDGLVANLFHVTLAFLGNGSLLLGFLTLLPTRSGGFYSDGARILRLLRENEETEREVALITLTGLTLGGTRPRDWNAALVRRSAEIRDGGAFEVGGLQFAYAHALDKGDVAAARTHLHAALRRTARLPAASRAAVQLTAATYYALFEDDAAQARSFLNLAGRGGQLSAPHQRRLAEAAVLLAERRIAEAVELAHAARDLIERAVDRGSAALDDTLALRIISAGTGSPRNPG